MTCIVRPGLETCITVNMRENEITETLIQKLKAVTTSHLVCSLVLLNNNDNACIHRYVEYVVSLVLHLRHLGEKCPPEEVGVKIFRKYLKI